MNAAIRPREPEIQAGRSGQVLETPPLEPLPPAPSAEVAAIARENILRDSVTGTDEFTNFPRQALKGAEAQLQEELGLVAKHKLGGFFLIYRDLQGLATEVAREVRGAGTARGGSGLPPGRGRGSAVSSIICYLIGLSHVDPVRNKLFLHRFLNEDLQTVPDIDLDFARDIREHLILRVLHDYGHDHAALVCSFATYHLRSAVRELGKVLGLPEAALESSMPSMAIGSQGDNA